VPDNVEFAIKPTLAREMIARALDADTPAAWVAGDEVYGADPRLRSDLHDRRIGYVLAVAKDHQVTTAAGRHKRVDLVTRLPARIWARHSAGAGATGHVSTTGRSSRSSPTSPTPNLASLAIMGC
jgi:SRSO17 transposase